MRLAILVGTVIVLLVMAVAGSYALTLYSIHRDDQRWCSTLVAITSTSASTSQMQIVHNRLQVLEGQFGC